MSTVGRNYRVDRRTRRLRVEVLEDRRMLATFNVTNLLDGPVTAPGDLPGSLRQAMFDANNLPGADEITFSVNGTIAIGSQLPTITDDLTITGPGQALLTIDAGNGTDNAPGTSDGYRIFNIEDGNDATFIDVELAGMTLTGGDIADFGGAIRNSENLTVLSSTITGNSSRGGRDGGGIYTRLGDLSVTNSMVSHNFSSGAGGIAGQGGNVSIVESLITGNGSFGWLELGGGIGLRGSNLSVHESTISENYTQGFDSNGGGIGIRDGSLIVTSSLISDNHVTQYGMNSSGYSYRAYGGGISLRFSTGSLSNVTISGNTATAGGGGIDSHYSDLIIDNSTIAHNDVGVIRRGNPGSLAIENTIIARNNSSDLFTNSTSSLTAVNYSLIEDPGSSIYTGTNNIIGVDPLLGPLQNNGGPTFTHALLPGSPAIDMGDPSFSVPPDSDQRGEPFDRVYNGRIDIGSYESQPLMADVNGDHRVDSQDFLWIQRNGGDFVRWNAEYGLSEPPAPPPPLAPSLVSMADSTVEQPISVEQPYLAEPLLASVTYWLSLPERLSADQSESSDPTIANAANFDKALESYESATELLEAPFNPLNLATDYEEESEELSDEEHLSPLIVTDID